MVRAEGERVCRSSNFVVDDHGAGSGLTTYGHQREERTRRAGWLGLAAIIASRLSSLFGLAMHSIPKPCLPY